MVKIERRHVKNNNSEETMLIFDYQYDYTGGNLSELLDIIISSGATLFVSAVGIPPQWAIDKLHKAGVL
jgi:hypothetical protein